MAEQAPVTGLFFYALVLSAVDCHVVAGINRLNAFFARKNNLSLANCKSALNIAT
ncbi:hypothetical protein LHGZ1_1076 [Laribacter hongkongensis]|uniref:Uncharacterized protein n=1 Tax=Laribacter hongkongensis TaxID=168471 RepID=A0A248LGM7_9NEIS|nr:hypothetical protein LHGZ1_1076 [Laribacter hongkongensis]